MKSLKEIDITVKKNKEEYDKSINNFIKDNMDTILFTIEQLIVESRENKKTQLVFSVREMVIEKFPRILSYKSYEVKKLLSDIRVEIVKALKDAGYLFIGSKVNYDIYIYFNKSIYAVEKVRKSVTNNKWFMPVSRTALFGIAVYLIYYCSSCIISVLNQSTFI